MTANSTFRWTNLTEIVFVSASSISTIFDSTIFTRVHAAKVETCIWLRNPTPTPTPAESESESKKWKFPESELESESKSKIFSESESESESGSLKKFRSRNCMKDSWFRSHFYFLPIHNKWKRSSKVIIKWLSDFHSFVSSLYTRACLNQSTKIYWWSAVSIKKKFRSFSELESESLNKIFRNRSWNRSQKIKFFGIGVGIGVEK
jgi:hypothetical protein